jgi:hypothetical protein
VQFAGRSVEDDVSPGDWIAAVVRPIGEHVVGALVPPVFGAYARVFHPAVRYDGDDDVDVTWADVAAGNGTTAHPAMQWTSITGSWEFRDSDDQPGLWNDAPPEGHLPVTVAARLAAVLARHTTTPEDCWFGLWAGFGFMLADGPVLELPDRELWLVRGPVTLATANLAAEPNEQSANLWWPADRAWCVATDIDQQTTFVGGSPACIAEVLGTHGIEAAPAAAGQRIAWDSDTVNPLPDDVPG